MLAAGGDAAVTPYSHRSLGAMHAFGAGHRLNAACWLICWFFAAIAAPAAALAETATAPCRGEPIATATVARVLDGATFILDDGREVRLGGIDAPPFGDAEAASADAKAGAEAKAKLESLVAGGPVVLKRVGPSNDRYGRVVAQVFANADGAERWIQAEMVGSGFARVSARVGDRACAAELLRRERLARDGKLGLWAAPYYVMRHAEDFASVAADRGRFALVEGKVLSVRESGGTIYVNFGRRWSEDFTVTIAKRNARLFTAAGLEPKKLQGRQIRVRGWIEERGGPWIDARRPEQIEIVETSAR